MEYIEKLETEQDQIIGTAISLCQKYKVIKAKGGKGSRKIYICNSCNLEDLRKLEEDFTILEKEKGSLSVERRKKRFPRIIEGVSFATYFSNTSYKKMIYNVEEVKYMMSTEATDSNSAIKIKWIGKKVIAILKNAISFIEDYERLYHDKKAINIIIRHPSMDMKANVRVNRKDIAGGEGQGMQEYRDIQKVSLIREGTILVGEKVELYGATPRKERIDKYGEVNPNMIKVMDDRECYVEFV